MTREQFDNIISKNDMFDLTKLEYLGQGNESVVFTDGLYVYKKSKSGFLDLDTLFKYVNLILKANILLDLSPCTEFIACLKMGLKYYPAFKQPLFKPNHNGPSKTKELIEKQGWQLRGIDGTDWILKKDGCTYMATDMIIPNTAIDSDGKIRFIDARHIAKLDFDTSDTMLLYLQIDNDVKSPHKNYAHYLIAPIKKDKKSKKLLEQVLYTNRLYSFGFTKCILN